MSQQATAIEPLAPERSFANPAVALCLELSSSSVAVLDERGVVLWCNARWRKLDTASPGAGFATQPRQAVLQRVCSTRGAVRFREWREGCTFVTTLAPLARSRILVMSTLASAWSPPIAGPACDEIDPGLDRASPAASLSGRERDVAKLLLSGSTIRGAADRLNLSVKTIEGHRDSIYRKLSVRNRAGFADAMRRAGFVAD